MSALFHLGHCWTQPQAKKCTKNGNAMDEDPKKKYKGVEFSPLEHC